MKSYWTSRAWKSFDPDAERNDGCCEYETYVNGSHTKEVSLTPDEKTEFEDETGISLVSDVVADEVLALMISRLKVKER